MSARFKRKQFDVEGPVLFERAQFGDDRGVFSRLFCSDELADLGWDIPIAQINISRTSSAGTVRGMHFQHPPYAEKKLVTCLSGAILDVAVDIRKDSPTFLSHIAVELSAERPFSFLVPEGFAHGFQALEDDTQVLYCTSAPYAPEHESGIRPLDPRLAIDWPLPVVNLSARDDAHPLLEAGFAGIGLA